MAATASAQSGADFFLHEEKIPPITRKSPIQQNSSLMIRRPFGLLPSRSNIRNTGSELSVAAIIFRTNFPIRYPFTPALRGSSSRLSCSHFSEQNSDPEAKITFPTSESSEKDKLHSAKEIALIIRNDTDILFILFGDLPSVPHKKLLQTLRRIRSRPLNKSYKLRRKRLIDILFASNLIFNVLPI